MEYRLLGAIEIRGRRRPIDIGHSRQRAVLAVLMAEANRVVAFERLQDRIWPRTRPASAYRTLHSYLSRLRRILAEQAARRPTAVARIERRSGGYVFVSEPDSIDMHRFRSLVRRAGTGTRRAAELLGDALALWRGEPFEALDLPWFNQLRATLESEREAASLLRNDALLAAGDHHLLAAELEAQTAAGPLDERRTAQLMLALYRSGRQVDALAEYHRVRTALSERFGVDTDPALRQLYKRIVAQDPSLRPAPATPPAARTSLRTPPHRLPAQPPDFVGRRRALRRLRPGGVTAITGMAGVGKTWLALQWGYRHLDAFPDGRLCLDLHGYGGGTPLSPYAALGRLLESCGTPPAEAPRRLGDRAAAFRDLAAGRRMLLILDDARDDAHVAPLLPGDGTCTTLVTSRRRLTGLAALRGARHVPVPPLTEADAEALVAARLGSRWTSGGATVRRAMLAHCEGLPMALGLLAAHMAAHPGVSPAEMAAELDGEPASLDVFGPGDAGEELRLRLDASAHTLSGAGFAVLTALGRLPAAAFTADDVSAHTGLPPELCREPLDELADAHLIEPQGGARYRTHRVVRRYAMELVLSGVEA